MPGEDKLVVCRLCVIFPPQKNSTSAYLQQLKNGGDKRGHSICWCSGHLSLGKIFQYQLSKSFNTAVGEESTGCGYTIGLAGDFNSAQAIQTTWGWRDEQLQNQLQHRLWSEALGVSYAGSDRIVGNPFDVVPTEYHCHIYSAAAVADVPIGRSVRGRLRVGDVLARTVARAI